MILPQLDSVLLCSTAAVSQAVEAMSLQLIMAVNLYNHFLIYRKLLYTVDVDIVQYCV